MSIHSTGIGDLGSLLLVNPRKAREMLSCSHKKLYQLMADGELQSFKDGRSQKIVVESIRQYVARRLDASASSKLKRPR